MYRIFILVGMLYIRMSFTNEVQAYHWNNPQFTLYPIVIYYKKDGIIQHKSFCFLSDDLNNDISRVYEIQRIFTSYLKSSFPNLNKMQMNMSKISLEKHNGASLQQQMGNRLVMG